MNYSLRKEYSIPELLSITQEVNPLYIQPKIDGFSVILEYKNGELKKVSSKSGKDLIGQDIFPEIVQGFSGWIRGEMIIKLNRLDKYSYKQNRRGAFELYKKGVLEDLVFIVFDSSNGNTFLEKSEFCQKLGFEVIPTGIIPETKRSEKEFELLFGTWIQKFSEIYPLDGIVLLSDSDFREDQDNSYSRSRIAYKQIEEEYEVEVLGVEEKKNRFGTVIYVAEFEMNGRKKVVLGKEIEVGDKIQVGRVRGYESFIPLLS